MKDSKLPWRPMKVLPAEWRGLKRLAKRWGEGGRDLRMTDVVRRLLAIQAAMEATKAAEVVQPATGTEGR